MQSFSGKNILVIGASSGIGYSLAQMLIEAGANVYSASRHEPTGLDVHHINIDITAMQDGALDALPEILHGLAYCPGSITLKPFHRLTEEDFLKEFHINVLGAVKSVQLCLPRLKKANGASMVLFSSVAATVGMNFHTSISAAKGAVEGLAKSLAAELAPSQIRVNVVAPSLTDTPLAKSILSSDERREASAKRHPLGRIGRPEDAASAAAFLLSASSSWITGQTLGVDGGMGALR